MQSQSTKSRTCQHCQATYPAIGSRGIRFCSRACWFAGGQTKDVDCRFWSKVQKTDGCWLWIGTMHPKGYGAFSMRVGDTKRARRATHVAWEMAYGPKPKDACVLHRCDNPACVRPDHLFLGTQQDNMRDMYQKDRHPKGEDRGHAKLTASQVVEMRRLYAAGGVRQKDLAIQFGISQGIVSEIISRKRWTHVA